MRKASGPGAKSRGGGLPSNEASPYWQVMVRVFATGGIDSRYVPMSAASLGVMLASARIPQRATPFLSLAVVMVAATWLVFQLMRPVASGVRFALWIIFMVPLTVTLATLPP